MKQARLRWRRTALFASVAAWLLPWSPTQIGLSWASSSGCRILRSGQAHKVPAGFGTSCSEVRGKWWCWPSKLAEGKLPKHGKSARMGKGKAEAEADFAELLEMKKDLAEIQVDPRPRGGKRIGGDVWFDVELNLPLGLRLDTAPMGDAVGVSEVLEGGSAAEHNKRHTVRTARDPAGGGDAGGFDEALSLLNFIQPGDRIVTVNSVRVSTQEDVMELVQQHDKEKPVRIKFSRNSRGPVTVIFPSPAEPIVVPASTRLYSAAVAAGHDVDLRRCEDSCSGDCWHINDISGEVYQLCVEGCTVSDVPSNTGVASLGKQVAAFASVAAGGQVITTTFDNTEPLILRRCPEIYERLQDPYVGNWMYPGGEYSIKRNGDVRTYEEKGFSGELQEDEEGWLVAELPPHGTIRVRPGQSKGLSVDMDSNWRAAGGDQWGETKTAFRT